MQDFLDLAVISQYLHPRFPQPYGHIKNPGALGKKTTWKNTTGYTQGSPVKGQHIRNNLTSLHSDTFATPSLQLHWFFLSA